MTNVEIHDEFWGNIIKDRDIDFYSCWKLLKGKEIEIAFDPVEDDLHEIIDHAKEFFSRIEENDMMFREYAAGEVLSNYREYIVKGAAITKEEIVNRMQIESLVVDSEGFTLSYEDDGICGDHIIMVFVDEHGEPCGVNIAG
ncbi:DUF2262 domain-containing protein [Paenibacillus sp. MZ04-78.2]|uniref:DUF2262 domain-containing protein n=1 Tax=Paenibacillus sp. MZ04-78.2 TaxID=2962034 RepID=UPI0020B87F42|nr:DUF2262 domain-containing protein [Paenibacillus sp. MZ04-78.2]MCP3774505.1 DUF2262 domain-containing protein [Paenibacillus sp. MZ04-78.2]